MTTKMPDRIAGALLPDTVITWTEDGTNIDPVGYTWQIQARALSSATVLFTKTTGITVGSTAGPTVTIAWTTADLGLLSAGVYLLELTGTTSSKPRKEQLTLQVITEV